MTRGYRFRPQLVDGSIYGIPALVSPHATGHDYFTALKRGKTKYELGVPGGRRSRSRRWTMRWRESLAGCSID
ncbi:hypothetical protein [Janibacter hoylei]|uniref:hypothetical protein n=1 Tax=Janibacter hoylei TaxID=364298 RepID=UPI0027B93EB0|nr:hypothetical protein [Janibacter hoylei]